MTQILTIFVFAICYPINACSQDYPQAAGYILYREFELPMRHIQANEQPQLKPEPVAINVQRSEAPSIHSRLRIGEHVYQKPLVSDLARRSYSKAIVISYPDEVQSRQDSLPQRSVTLARLMTVCSPAPEE